MTFSRRIFLSSSMSAPLLTACSGFEPVRDIDFAAFEAASGGMIGICAFDMSTGHIFSHRAYQRFAMCSSFKWLLGAFILAKVENGEDSLSRIVDFAAEDLVFFSPVLEKFLSQGQLSVGALCEAAIAESDNTATNLLLMSLGGPKGFTQRLRDHGDKVTRLDRIEPFLNSNTMGDMRDTTTPMSMMFLMKDFLFGKALEEDSQIILRGWMEAANTGRSRLRAGLPAGWMTGNKTGTSTNNANNDVAFAMAPDKRAYDRTYGPVIIASFLNMPNPLKAEADAIHASMAREIMQSYAAKASY